MEKNITKETVEELMKIEGEVRGVALRSHAQFITNEKGEEGLRKLEEKMAGLGCPIEYKKIRSMDFCPIAREVITLLAIKEVFNYDDEKFQQIGAFQPKISLIIKTFMKYFISLKMMAEQTPTIWKKYYTVGEFEVIELNEEKKYVNLRLKDFRLHPLHCQVLIGYFSSIVKMIVKSPATCEEIKCPFLGDDYHEFVLRW